MKPQTLTKHIKQNPYFRCEIRDALKYTLNQAFSYIRLCPDYQNTYQHFNTEEKEEFINTFTTYLQSLLPKEIKDLCTYQKIEYQMTGEWNRNLRISNEVRV